MLNPSKALVLKLVLNFLAREAKFATNAFCCKAESCGFSAAFFSKNRLDSAMPRCSSCQKALPKLAFHDNKGNPKKTKKVCSKCKEKGKF